MVLYGRIHNDLKYIDESIPVADREKIEWLHQVVKGRAPAPVEGPDVFQILTESVS